ncbi:MAG: hypothetical protein ABI758_04955 [Candidatus Woesebacteria bacterium]
MSLLNPEVNDLRLLGPIDAFQREEGKVELAFNDLSARRKAADFLALLDENGKTRDFTDSERLITPSLAREVINWVLAH